MEAAQKRINVTLDGEYAAKLEQLAKRSHVQEGTLARSLLCVAIDSASPDAAHVHALLTRIPGAIERIEAGHRDAIAGNTIPIDEL